MMKRLCVLLAVVVVAACTSTSGVGITEDQLVEMKQNKASVQDVIGRFGRPTGTALMPNGERLLTYSQSKVHFDPKAAIPVVGMFVNESGFSSASVSLTFGQDGRLVSYATQNQDFGGGGTSFSAGK